MESMEATKKHMIVVAVPLASTVEEMEAALNAPFDEGYYFVSMAGEHEGALRALYKIRVRPANELQDAAAYVRANHHKDVKQIVQGLAGMGITRSPTWVKTQRELV